MKLYYWQSKALQDWAPGYIVVTAPSVQVAKYMARLSFYMGENGKRPHLWQLFEAGLMQEPEELQYGVFLETGSC